MTVEQTILPSYMLPILAGIVTAGYGITFEKHYVAPISIVSTVLNLFITWSITPIWSVNFGVVTSVMGIGLFVICRDVRKKYKNFWVAFLLGSKTIGTITLYLGLLSNNWIINFNPVFLKLFPQYIADSNEPLYLNIFAFCFILGIIHTIGIIVTKTVKRRIL